MIDPKSLLADARALAKQLVDDLRTHADAEVVHAEYQAARAAGRTALSEKQWAEGWFEQVAVSWVLGCVFVRFCEDNALVADALLSGPGARRDLARDQRAAYLREHPAHDDRHWLRHVFSRYRDLPATGDLFGAHNPVWLLEPSADGARELVQAFNRIDPESGNLVHDFTDATWDTRFLGDLYQDLSDHAKKQFALLQTPVFVEEFILDRTLEPAIATFGLRDTDVIDPTCGSGHFLLGAFRRLFEHWVQAEPATNRRELARRTLEQVGGVDINPFAVAVARFRLLVDALRAGGDTRLIDAPTYPINVAVGDSLLHGEATTGQLDVDDATSAARHGYATEDLTLAKALLSREWAAVVGNPPYITVKDPALNTVYRLRYDTCRGKYSLGVPFTERFWQLARLTPSEPERAGYVGMITANSFMKREMGKDLIEQWIPRHDLTHLVDTSGAYIPGHGTPTVILFGRNRRPASRTVRAVMGIRGEPSTPAVPEKGLVWTSIVDHVDEPGSETEFVSVVDLERERLATHPWSIGGGGAAELKERLDGAAGRSISDLADAVGITSVTGEDDLFVVGSSHVADRRGLSPTTTLVIGEDIRDWCASVDRVALWTYNNEFEPELSPGIERALWIGRAAISRRRRFGTPMLDRGLKWWEWQELYAAKLRTPLSITFAFVATHNHFVLDRGGKVFKQSAPVIKLPEGASEADHLDLLGPLNSSTACFWMKQVYFPKGGDQVGNEGARIRKTWWDERYEFDGTKLQKFPVPQSSPRSTATELDHLAQQLDRCSPGSLAERGTPSSDVLAAARVEWTETRRRMIGLQEQLDWECYRHYGLLDEELTLPGGEPPIDLGQRAFEIVLARKMAAGTEQTTWFSRHGSTPITEVPAEWPEDYRRLVERRIELIETNAEIGLIERPEYKRRWNTTPWDVQQADALRGWLLDRLESPDYWHGAVQSVSQLASHARTDAEFMQVARLFAGRDDVDVTALVSELVRAEAVPYLAPLRYTESGMRKWAQWCETWDLQRREDAGEDVGEIPVPPKYAKADFTGVAWTHRGKLDVPKERFVSYPGLERDTDTSLVVGWAGWDHLERARALAQAYLRAKTDGRDAAALTPLLAGLAELEPWLLQWYDDPNPDPALDRPGTQIAGLIDAELRGLHLTRSDLAAWRPPTATRGKRRRT